MVGMIFLSLLSGCVIAGCAAGIFPDGNAWVWLLIWAAGSGFSFWGIRDLSGRFSARRKEDSEEKAALAAGLRDIQTEIGQLSTSACELRALLEQNGPLVLREALDGAAEKSAQRQEQASAQWSQELTELRAELSAARSEFAAILDKHGAAYGDAQGHAVAAVTRCIGEVVDEVKKLQAVTDEVSGNASAALSSANDSIQKIYAYVNGGLDDRLNGMSIASKNASEQLAHKLSELFQETERQGKQRREAAEGLSQSFSAFYREWENWRKEIQLAASMESLNDSMVSVNNNLGTIISRAEDIIDTQHNWDDLESNVEALRDVFGTELQGAWKENGEALNRVTAELKNYNTVYRQNIDYVLSRIQDVLNLLSDNYRMLIQVEERYV